MNLTQIELTPLGKNDSSVELKKCLLQRARSELK